MPDQRETERISNELGLHKRLVELLMLRGYDNVDAINVFLHPSAEYFYPPDSMRGMSQCCERLLQAIDNEEKVVVYGDYDADGVTATAMGFYLSGKHWAPM